MAQCITLLSFAGNQAPTAVVLASEAGVVIDSCNFTSNAGGFADCDYGAGAVLVMDGNLMVSHSRQAHRLSRIA
jgi:hypothetical protein